MSNERSGSVLLLGMALALAGCGAGSEPGEVLIGSCAQALNAEQGLSFQGVSVQGMSLQGMHLQGLDLQGISAQGLTAQGVTPQGLQAQGLQAQGTRQSSTSIAGTALDPASFVRLELLEGELTATRADGAVIRGAGLEGVSLPFVTNADETLWLEIAHAERVLDSAPWLYAIQLEGHDLCGGDGLGLFVPGVWDETGRHLTSLNAGGRTLDATFSCRAGVIAKCALWGYEPWSIGAELHQACTRMARADYCGDGTAHTEEGTLIDLFDRHGIQTPVGDARMSFEAGWGPDGATCVSQPRYFDVAPDGAVKLPACWDEKPRCDTWEKARTLGASLGNESAHETRELACGAL